MSSAKQKILYPEKLKNNKEKMQENEISLSFVNFSGWKFVIVAAEF